VGFPGAVDGAGAEAVDSAAAAPEENTASIAQNAEIKVPSKSLR
jgi:hypothetical protein